MTAHSDCAIQPDARMRHIRDGPVPASEAVAGRTEMPVVTRFCMLESSMVTREQPLTAGALRSAFERGLPRYPSVKDELRTNLIAKLQSGEPLFPGIIGYDDTVVPQLINALLSKHNFILLGLRGQAKTRILRSLVDLLASAIPVVPGCEIHDDPLAPVCSACRARAGVEGDGLPVAWLTREERYVE